MLLGEPVTALTSFGLEALDSVPRLLHRAGHEPVDRVTLPAHGLHNLRNAGPVLPLEHRDHLSCLAAFARPSVRRLRGLLPLGAALAGVAFLVPLPLAGAPFAPCARPLDFLSGFGFAGAASGSGWAASPRPWMRAQMRAMAVFESFSFFTGFSPGRLFRIATRRSAGQVAAKSASSWSLAKVSKGVAVAAAASSGWRAP